LNNVPLLNDSHPHLSKEIITRYNNLARFLNKLSISDQLELQKFGYFALVSTVYQQALKTINSNTNSITLMMLTEVEEAYDNWATIEEAIRKAKHSPIPVKKRMPNLAKSYPYSSSSSSSSFFSSPTPAQPFHPQSSKENCVSATCFALAVGAGVLGVFGVAIALEPVAWLVALATLAVSPTFFCIGLALYVSAVAVLFTAAAVFGVLSVKAENQKTMGAPSPSFG
jgi:hypothetical protein